MTTKAERIRQLLFAGMCTSLIAELIPCRPEYVRTVKQRLSPARRKRDAALSRARRIAYREARKAGASRKDAQRAMSRSAGRLISLTCDRAAARQAYHAAKKGTSHA